VNKELASRTNFHTYPACRVYLLGAIVLVTHCELIQFTCYVTSSTRIGVPICVHCVRSSGCCSGVLLLQNEFFIEPIPTPVHRVPDLATHLTLRPIRIVTSTTATRIHQLVTMSLCRKATTTATSSTARATMTETTMTMSDKVS
jgi:hypothetical protein